ncbi:MAG: SecDF P1 head subdomain-containing protein, partial [Candidatus Saccharimonadales bacterium]
PSLRRLLAMILDGEIRSAPSLTSRIEGRGEINGNFTEDEVELLCATLSAGALPSRLKLLSESVVAP